MTLASEKCEICRPDSPSVDEAEREQLLAELPGWSVIDDLGMLQLVKKFEFSNFLQAVEVHNKIAALAEEENHHPELVTEWGGLTVKWWTHSIGGLHRNDFIMAARCNQLDESR